MDGAADVLQRLRTRVFEADVQATAQRVVNRGGDGYATWLGEALDASRHVDAVTVNVTVFKQDIAEIDPDAKFDPAIPLRTGVPRLHSPLDLDRA